MDQRTDDTRRAVIGDILKERNHQLKRWGPGHDEMHGPSEWVTILNIYLGKAAMESPLYQGDSYRDERFKKRLVQVAAICMAALERM